MTERTVFVYGTLRAGEANDVNRLSPKPSLIGAATVRGRLYDLGSYPGLVLDDEAGEVLGEVYRIAPELEAELDRIEEIYPTARDEYIKREVEVACAGGRFTCLVYEVNQRYLAGRPRIALGDWQAYRRSKQGQFLG
jgi:gamma-glutamylcyclotransferase (GGCT)/AIG2-like uncharacterized protein YtfP